MFATLLGTYPAPPDSGSPADARRTVIEALAAAGLEPISDGRGARELRSIEDVRLVVDEWRASALWTDRAVKQSLLGPNSLAAGAGVDAVEAAERTREAIRALADAGCPLVEIEEPAALALGGDDVEGARFAEALRRATADVAGHVHLSLVLTGGNVDALGAATIYDLPFSSYAFDLIAGPENWRLITQAPADRGIVVGALDPSSGADDRPEVLVWAAHYAASTGGRGLIRVGLANASGLGGLSWDRAAAKVRALGEAARIAASSSAEEIAAALDPRAVDIRSAALGQFDPAERRRRDHR